MFVFRLPRCCASLDGNSSRTDIRCEGDICEYIDKIPYQCSYKVLFLNISKKNVWLVQWWIDLLHVAPFAPLSLGDVDWLHVIRYNDKRYNG